MVQAAQKLYTADDLERLSAQGYRYELDRGILVEMSPPGDTHGRSTSRVGVKIGGYIYDHDLGAAFGAETGFLLETDPDVVLAPDFAFTAKERDPGPRVRGYPVTVPDLVVEVKSPDDSSPELIRKLEKWIAYGVRMAIGVDPLKRTAIVMRPETATRRLSDEDMLSGEDILPGFEIQVGALMEPDRKVAP